MQHWHRLGSPDMVRDREINTMMTEEQRVQEAKTETAYWVIHKFLHFHCVVELITLINYHQLIIN